MRSPSIKWLVSAVLLSCNLPQAATQAVATADIDATVSAVFAATQGLDSAPAEGGESTPTATPPPPPDFNTISLPPNVGTLTERDGQWYVDEQPVALAYHANENGGHDLWLTHADQPGWPILIQKDGGVWQLGIEAWDGAVTVANLTEVTVSFAMDLEGEEAFTKEITPYEVFNLPTLPAGDYVVRFRYTAEGSHDLACTLRLQPGVPVSFGVVPLGVAVSTADFAPESAEDLDVRTSPLCGGGQ